MSQSPQSPHRLRPSLPPPPQLRPSSPPPPHSWPSSPPPCSWPSSLTAPHPRPSSSPPPHLWASSPLPHRLRPSSQPPRHPRTSSLRLHPQLLSLQWPLLSPLCHLQLSYRRTPSRRCSRRYYEWRSSHQGAHRPLICLCRVPSSAFAAEHHHHMTLHRRCGQLTPPSPFPCSGRSGGSTTLATRGACPRDMYTTGLVTPRSVYCRHRPSKASPPAATSSRPGPYRVIGKTLKG
jgi:hypothetical protein